MALDSTPTVSVVIPAYNCASFLDATLSSVFAQTYTDFEVVVVDDGSTDNTQQVLAPYLDRIINIVQTNRGLPGARNAGIQAARGAFIALLDADDCWTPDKLARQMPGFADAEVGIVASDFSVRYADGSFQQSYLVNRPLAQEGFVFDRYIQSRFLFPSAMVLRRTCFEQCGLFDEHMLACEDIELFARICLRWKVAIVHASLMIRYEGSHNITANQARMSEYTIRALRQILVKEPHMPAHSRFIVRKELGQQYWWNGYAALAELDLARTRRSLLQAMRFDRTRVYRCVPLVALSLLPKGLILHVRSRRAHRRAMSPEDI